MQQRFEDFQTCFNHLDFTTDIQNNATNFATWDKQWMSYVYKGGDRPPTNPTHP